MSHSDTSTTLRPGESAASGRWPLRLWGALIVLCGALFLDALDTSMVGVALPSIKESLDLSTSSLQWVVSGYVLGYGGFLLLGGRAADLLGRRRVFLTALAVFAVASLLSGMVNDGDLLIATRFVKGISAAFTAPAGLSIITTTFAEGPDRNRALSIYTTCGAAGFSLGLVLSGLLTEAGWRWTLLVPAPVAALILVAGWKLIDHDRPAPAGAGRGGYDILGAITSTGAVLVLVFGIVRAPEEGWLAPVTLGTFAAAVALGVAFVAVERRVANPLVRLGVLRSPSLIRALIGGGLMFGGYASFQFVVTQYLQTLSKWSALHTALAFLPAGLIVLFSSFKIADVLNRYGTARVGVAGFAFLSLGYLQFLRIGQTPSWWVILPSIVALGLGFGMAFPAINVQAASGIADEEQGLVSGLLNTALQVGITVVLAASTAIIAANGGAGARTNAQVLASYRPVLVFVALATVAGLLILAGGCCGAAAPRWSPRWPRSWRTSSTS
ncbi:MFS transporter [Catenulispora yoronensis]